MSPNALKRLWNSGLADAGIHNLFLGEDEVFFFDLGEPQLQSIPGFMTKFLFSFFHTLGMQEDEEGEWVHRFVIKGEKLGLTDSTKALLPEAYNAFAFALDKIIVDLFDGDEGLRWLLLQYVTLQLLSDAAFCIQRWEMKGGGRPREGNHNTGLHKWLWRALWDAYIAFDINTEESWERFEIEQFDNQDEINAIGHNIRQSIRFDPSALQKFRRISSAGVPDTPPSTPYTSNTDRPTPNTAGELGMSLRDLTMSTYKLQRTITRALGELELSDVDSSDTDDTEEDGSAIFAPSSPSGSGYHL
jgi:hypothetical protein